MHLCKELNSQLTNRINQELPFPPQGQELDRDLAKVDLLQLVSNKYHLLPKPSKTCQQHHKTILLHQWTKTQCQQFKICKPTLVLWTILNHKLRNTKQQSETMRSSTSFLWAPLRLIKSCPLQLVLKAGQSGKILTYRCKNQRIRYQARVKSNRIKTPQNTAKISRFQNFHQFYKSGYSVKRIWQIMKMYLKRKQASGSQQELEETTSTKSRSSLMISIKKRWNIDIIDSMSERTFCSLNRRFSTSRNHGTSGQRATFWARDSSQNHSRSRRRIKLRKVTNWECLLSIVMPTA